tara:strand:- start:10265 stop:10525 length:261 start_codon:yes stop_codon:yes gene_type:complete
MEQKQSERNLLDAIRAWAKDAPSPESLCQVMQTLGANIKDANSLGVIVSNAFGSQCLINEEIADVLAGECAWIEDSTSSCIADDEC